MAAALPHDRHSRSASPASHRISVLTRHQLVSVLPGPGDLPGKWKALGARDDGGQFDGSVATAGRGYSAPDLAGFVGFRAESFQSVPAAITRYAHDKSQWLDRQVRSVSVAGADDAFRGTPCETCGATITIRIGTVVVWVHIDPNGHGIPRLPDITDMLAKRIHQVLDGEQSAARIL